MALAKQAIKYIGRLPWLDRLLWHGGQYLEESESSYLSSEWQSSRIFGRFTSSGGGEISLIRGLRDQIKPNWKAMLVPQVAEPPASTAVQAKRLDTWREKYYRVNSFLSTFGISIKGKNVLEIGAYDGVTAYTLADAGAGSVLGIDIAAYYINQTKDEEVNRESVGKKNIELKEKREGYRRVIGPHLGDLVSFSEDDICASSVVSGSMDVIFSWEVMEHVIDPAAAFNEMYRMLKPGGVVFHEYNPFFSLTGGHSLCTLDFLWGHARLTNSDFERYLDQIRPDEKELALSFYHNNLNRMTLSDLQRYIENAGLTPLSILPWPKRKHLDLVTNDILSQCVDVYPTATVNDLISPFVWVLLQK